LTFKWTQKTPDIPSASGISSLPFLSLQAIYFPGIYSSAADLCRLKIRAASPVEIVLGPVLIYTIVDMQL
jgi:hypothetical protein